MPGLTSLQVAWAHAATARDLVVEAKERAGGVAAHVLGHAMRAHARSVGVPRGALLCPTPPSRRRRRRRWHLAAHLARAAALAVDGRAVAWLRRARECAPQTSLDALERRNHLRGSFALARRAASLPEEAWIVDDVVTTGSTLVECARALRAGGVQRVHALCLTAAAAPATDADAG